MKKFITILLTVAIVFSVAGCSKANSKSSESSSSGEKLSGTITIWHTLNPTQSVPLKNLISNYESEHSGAKINLQYVASSAIVQQLQVGAAANELPDIAQSDVCYTQSFAAMGLFKDITSRVNAWPDAKNFYKYTMEACEYKGKYYAIPFYANCLALYYNKDILDKAGIKTLPKTWAELKEDVIKTTSGDVYGFAESCIGNADGVFQFMPWLYAAGADWNTLDSQGAKDALNFLTDIYKGGYMSKQCLTEGQSDLARAAFQTGKAAFIVNGPWILANIKKESPNLNYGVTMLPSAKGGTSYSCLGGYDFGIINSSKNADLCWDFLKNGLLSFSNSEYFNTNAGYFSPRKDVMEGSSYWKNDPVYKPFIEQMSTAKTRGPYVKWPQVQTIMASMIQQSLTGSKTTDVALKEAAAQIKALDK